ncbi:methyltransferase domain-containing protein [Polynucleobacter sp. TUM22923]|jgi:malonyl-CoA O-methyltransferase|uniref:methyltransferase domain-containing protein n=1 Tax=Polynucleobacter sp. TUM22923 TaxID=3022126 RepID=UPI0025723975|nr:methyltransferase domain-containing protein [Polynucleobacter sp. TUM22923]
MTQSIAWLQDEIADRMLQKLDIVKLDVKDVLVLPDFLGLHTLFLAKRFPGVRFHSAPESEISGFARWQFRVRRWWNSRCRAGAFISMSDFEKTGRIDLPDHSVDLVFSTLLIQDLPDPKYFLRECWRVLKEGGLLSFSYLGPDTGKELQVAGLAKQLAIEPLASPWDMHDMGDALLGERFSDPVMDMEFLHLEYVADELLITDAIALKLVSSLGHRTPKVADLPKKLTLEVIYGHAWALGKHLAKPQDHIAYIDPKQIQRKTTIDSD